MVKNELVLQQHCTFYAFAESQKKKNHENKT